MLQKLQWDSLQQNELTAGSWTWCCTESEMVSSPHPLQLALNHLHQNCLKQGMCSFSAIQAHTVDLSKCNLAAEHSVFASNLLTVSGPISSTVSVLFEHRTTSCFYRLHCTVFIRNHCSLFAARLSRYTSADSLALCDRPIARLGVRVGTVVELKCIRSCV